MKSLEILLKDFVTGNLEHLMLQKKYLGQQMMEHEH